MIAGLEKVNTVSAHQIHKAMLLGQPVRPHAGSKILQRFWFPKPLEGITSYRFHQSKYA
jgi:hypothetical protein